MNKLKRFSITNTNTGYSITILASSYKEAENILRRRYPNRYEEYVIDQLNQQSQGVKYEYQG